MKFWKFSKQENFLSSMTEKIIELWNRNLSGKLQICVKRKFQLPAGSRPATLSTFSSSDMVSNLLITTD